MESRLTTSVKQLFFAFVEHLGKDWRKVATLSLLADIERYICQEFAYFLCDYGNRRYKDGGRAIYAITDIGRRDRCFDMALVKQAKNPGGKDKDAVFALLEAKYATNYQKLPNFRYKTFDNIRKNIITLGKQVACEIEGDGPLTRNFNIPIRSKNRHIYATMWACFKIPADEDAERSNTQKKKFFEMIKREAKDAELAWHGKWDSANLITAFEDKLVHLGARKYRVTLKAGFWVTRKNKED